MTFSYRCTGKEQSHAHVFEMITYLILLIWVGDGSVNKVLALLHQESINQKKKTKTKNKKKPQHIPLTFNPSTRGR